MSELFAFLGDEPIDHQPCAECVRCATCRREWCPTVMERCPGEGSWWKHPTGRDAEETTTEETR